MVKATTAGAWVLMVLNLGLAAPAPVPPVPPVEPAAPAAPADAAAGPRDLSKALARAVEEGKLPGMAAVVVRDGRIVARGAAGVRAMGRPEGITLEDRFHLGSCTKAMTATLCAVLVEEGVLRWEMTLGEVFAAEAEGMDAAWRGVTLRQLVTNRSGAPGGLDRDGLWTMLALHTGTPTEARRGLLVGVTRHPPEHPPGTKHLYSNAGFALAGHVAESVTGKPFEELMETRLWRPLGITTGGWGAPGMGEKGVSQPRGHRRGKAVAPGPRADNPAAIAPAGRAHMTLEDWAKFAWAHAAGEREGIKDTSGKVLVPAAEVRRLHEASEAPADMYAAGWVVQERPRLGGRTLWHNGSNTMWYCAVRIVPEKGVAALVACNAAEEARGVVEETLSALVREEVERR